jgi:hypothetical protein
MGTEKQTRRTLAPADAEAVPPAQTGTFTRTAIWCSIILTSLAWTVRTAYVARVNEDELEHLHAAWLWNQGIAPFTGFFQHHPPAFWLLLRPLVAGDSKDLLDLIINARMLSLAIIALTIGGVYWLSLRLLGKPVALIAAALWAMYCAFSVVTIHARPDMLMLLLMLGGTALTIEGFGMSCGARGRSRLRTMVGGVLLGASVCVLTKAAFWVLGLTGALALLAFHAAIKQKDRSLLTNLCVLAAGMALPAAIELGLVAAFSDLGQFWFCHVVANSKIANGMWEVGDAMKLAVSKPMTWPMLSAVIAIVGAATFGTSRGDGAGERKLIALGTTLGAVVLVLVGLPWDQYHLPLLVMMAGFAGLGFACGVQRLPSRGQTGAALAVLGLAIIWPWSMELQSTDALGMPTGGLKTSLAPYQYVLDSAKPGDTYLSMLNISPVKMMDSEPKLWMHMMCFQKPEDLKLLVDAIVKDKPRFVVGFENPFFVPRGGTESLHLAREVGPDGQAHVWAMHSFIGKVPADEVFRWYDSLGHGLLQRRDRPRQDLGPAGDAPRHASAR